LIKQQQGLGQLIPKLKEVLWVTWYQNALHPTGKPFVKGRVNPRDKLHSYFKKLPQPPHFQQQHTDPSAVISTEARPSTSKKMTC